MKRPWSFGMAPYLGVLCAVVTWPVGLDGQTVAAPPGPAPGRTFAAFQPDTPAQGSILLGRVVDGETGNPVSGAVVSIITTGARETPDTPRIMTDASGRFFFNDLATGKYTVDVTKPGWIPGSAGRVRPGGEAKPVEIRAGETPGDVMLTVWRYAVISGRVTDESGGPLVGTDVRIFRQTFPAGRRQFTFISRALTDDRGMYRFSALLPGEYVIAVPGTVTSEPPEMRGAGAPQEYLQTMTAIGTAPMSLARADGATGLGGPAISSILSLPGMPLADAAWTTFATTYFPSTAAQSLAGVVRAVFGRDRAGTDIAVRFVPTFQVKGTLNLPDGGAAAFHAVHLIAADAGDNPLANTATAVTDARGAFTFFGVPAGDYLARVVRTPAPSTPGFRMGVCGGTGAISFVCTSGSAPPPGGVMSTPTDDLLFADRTVSVVDRNVNEVAITLGQGARVSGRLEFEGASARPTDDAIRNMSAWLERADGLVFQPQGTNFPTEEPGRFTSEGQLSMPSSKPGRYLLRVTRLPAGWFLKGATHDGRDISEAPFDLRGSIGDIVVTFTDRAAEVRGEVRDANGQPDSAAIVLLFPVDATARVDYGRSSRRVQSAPVLAGRYSLPSPPPGDYLLIAVPDEQSVDWQRPERLEQLASLAERIPIAAGQTTTPRTLRTRRLP